MADELKFADCACFNLRRTVRRITQLYDRALAPSGLKTTQFILLAMLSGSGAGLSIGELADRLGMDRTTLTRNLGVVERAGLVTVGPGKNARSRAVQLSSKGRATLEVAVPLWTVVQSQVVDHMGADWPELMKKTHKLERYVSGG